MCYNVLSEFKGIDQLLFTPEMIRLVSWRIEVLLKPSDSSIYISVLLQP